MALAGNDITSQREIYQNNQKQEIYTEMQWTFGI